MLYPQPLSPANSVGNGDNVDGSKSQHAFQILRTAAWGLWRTIVLICVSYAYLLCVIVFECHLRKELNYEHVLRKFTYIVIFCLLYTTFIVSPTNQARSHAYQYVLSRFCWCHRTPFRSWWSSLGID